MLEKTLESPLDSEEIQPVHPKGNKSWIFTGRTDAEAEAPILWPPDVKSWLIGKDPDAGKDWGQEEKWGDRGWDGWTASPTQWTWVWVSSGSWWWTGRPGVLQSTGSQTVGHTWVTELNWTAWCKSCNLKHYAEQKISEVSLCGPWKRQGKNLRWMNCRIKRFSSKSQILNFSQFLIAHV